MTCENTATDDDVAPGGVCLEDAHGDRHRHEVVDGDIGEEVEVASWETVF